MQAVRNALHALADRGTGIGEIADEHADHLLTGPGLHRERAERAPGDAPGGAVVGSVERRSGERVNEGKTRNGCSRETAGDLCIRLSIGVVLDQQVDLGSDRRFRVRDGSRRIADIIEIEHIDRQRARRQLETAPDLGTGKAETLQRHTGGFVEIRQGDPKPPPLSPRRTNAASQQSAKK